MDKIAAAISNLGIAKSALSDAAIELIQKGLPARAAQVLNHITGVDEKINQLNALLTQLQPKPAAPAK